MAATAGTPMTFADAVANQMPDMFRKKYAANLLLALQEKQAKLRDTVTMIPDAGGEAFIQDFLTSWDLDDVTTRNAATTYSAEVSTRRQCGWTKSAKAYPVDETDPIALMLDPQWAIKENHARAARRRIDKCIYDTLFATVATGHNGTGTAEWASSNSDCKIIASGNKGLTKEKILQGKASLEANNIDLDDPSEQVTLVCHTDDVNYMIENDTTLSNSDYVNMKLIVEGKLEKVWGVRIKTVNHVFSTQTVTRRLGMYAKSAVYYGEPGAPVIYVEKNPMYNYRIELYCRIILGALRMFEGGVAEIQALVTPTAERMRTK